MALSLPDGAARTMIQDKSPNQTDEPGGKIMRFTGNFVPALKALGPLVIRKRWALNIIGQARI